MTVTDGHADGAAAGAAGAAGGPLRMIWAELGQECQIAFFWTNTGPQVPRG